MHIALTGATGFLGRYIARHLIQSSRHTLRCWHRPSSDRNGFDALNHAIEWTPGSLGDADVNHDSVTKLLHGVDAVVHAALHREPSQHGTFLAAGTSDLDEFLEANFMGSLRLFQAAHAAGVPRFIFISTCAVYDVILPDRPLDENHPLLPASHYGAHKAALEAFVHSFGFGQKWAICALRPTGIYGLAHPPSASRWFDLVAKVMRNDPIESARGGKEVHAQDVAKAVEVLLNADAGKVAGQAFNCYDRYVAEQDVAKIAKELTGSTSVVAEMNRGPKNQIQTAKLRALGMTFGGEMLLRKTVAELVVANRG
jgi:nucleoside-diphosphate-sugar epimerase